jgi:hypothetical protein
MIMAMEDGGSRRRSRAPNHPWNHPQLRLAATATNPAEARSCKVTMCVTRTELLALRSRAKGDSVSEFIRQHFPAELLTPLDQTSEA